MLVRARALARARIRVLARNLFVLFNYVCAYVWMDGWMDGCMYRNS